ncbi:MAG: hypothetical protein OWU33_08580, partial [Firmicutes bacterium]|nr:hypothetical protein [Bacillota bacterium]
DLHTSDGAPRLAPEQLTPGPRALSAPVPPGCPTLQCRRRALCHAWILLISPAGRSMTAVSGFSLAKTGDHSGWEPVGPPDYCVEVSGRSAFWARLYTHAAAAGVESRHCQRVVVMGDGAHWIWEEAPTYFGGAGKEVIEIVDFYHAAEHVWTVAHALYPADEAGAAAWAKPLVTALREQGPAPVQAALAAVHPDNPGGAAVVERERGYFAYHAARMDYPRYQREGLPLGAGRVDSACTVVLKQRLSQGGMRWTRAGAQAVATLRAWHRSGRWAALWASRPLIQRVPPKRRCAA